MSASRRWLSQIVRFARRKPLGAAGMVVLIAFVLVALLANVLAPYDPIERQSAYVLAPPGGHYLLGGDSVGRDVLSRMIHGSRISLYVGLLAVAIGVGAGSVWGIVSGYYGGTVDLVSQRVVDAMMSLPSLVLALTLVAVLGAGMNTVVIALGTASTPYCCRVVRSVTLSVKENAFVEAAQALGGSNPRILLFHILPNVTAPILVYATIMLGVNIIAEASLSFLGLGVPPPAPSWGAMLSGSNRLYMEMAPWLPVFPGLALSLVVLAFNLFGDSLRDVLDPRLRGSR